MNIRLYLIAFLASGYAFAWWLFAARSPAATTTELHISRAPEIDERQPRVAVWLYDLPAERQPQVELPAGWHIAERTAALPQAIPVPARVSPPRTGRIRTRSS
jgi:hypothetical protein